MKWWQEILSERDWKISGRWSFWESMILWFREMHPQVDWFQTETGSGLKKEELRLHREQEKKVTSRNFICICTWQSRRKNWCWPTVKYRPMERAGGRHIWSGIWSGCIQSFLYLIWISMGWRQKKCFHRPGSGHWSKDYRTRKRWRKAAGRSCTVGIVRRRTGTKRCTIWQGSADTAGRRTISLCRLHRSFMETGHQAFQDWRNLLPVPVRIFWPMDFALRRERSMNLLLLILEIFFIKHWKNMPDG